MALDIGRREFTAGLGSATLVWPQAAHAQQPSMPHIGFLNAASPEGYARNLAAFLKGLSDIGYVDSQNAAIEYRWAEGRIDRLPAMAADLVQRHVDVIAATSTPAALAAKAATATIPIVFETGADPIQLGLVTGLNRPEANVTGVTQTNNEITPKRLQLLHELLPAARVMALLVNPADRALAEITTKEVQAAALTLGLELHVLKATSESDFDGVFANLIQLRASGLVIGTGPFFNSQVEQLAALAVRNAVPAVYESREFISAGGLIGYGSDIAGSYRLAGNYTGRILKGDKPADLPVQEATKVELYINMRAAKALGITIPLPLLGRADEVIE